MYKKCSKENCNNVAWGKWSPPELAGMYVRLCMTCYSAAEKARKESNATIYTKKGHVITAKGDTK